MEESNPNIPRIFTVSGSMFHDGRLMDGYSVHIILKGVHYSLTNTQLEQYKSKEYNIVEQGQGFKLEEK